MNGKQVAEGRIERAQPLIFSADETADAEVEKAWQRVAAQME